MIELALGALALVALALVELTGASGGVLVGLVGTEVLVWVAVAVLVCARRLAPHGRRAAA
jgi:Na+/glutamate symporter